MLMKQVNIYVTFNFDQADVFSFAYNCLDNDCGTVSDFSGNYSEDLAATMLATTLGIEFDPDKAWDERKQEYKASGKIFKTSNITQSAQCNKNGLWTTTIAAAVFIIE